MANIVYLFHVNNTSIEYFIKINLKCSNSEFLNVKSTKTIYFISEISLKSNLKVVKVVFLKIVFFLII